MRIKYDLTIAKAEKSDTFFPKMKKSFKKGLQKVEFTKISKIVKEKG